MNRNNFAGSLWASKIKNIPPVLLIGAGGIGSHVAYLLTKIGYKVTIIDNDIVEQRNLGSQMYLKNAIGKEKVIAVKDGLSLYGLDIDVINDKYVEGAYPITIVAVDNMSTRRLAFENWCKLDQKDQLLFIDGRMSLEFLRVLTVINTQESKDYYLENCPEDEELPDLPCNARQTPHTGFIIGGIIAHVINAYLGQPLYALPKDVKFELSNFTFESNFYPRIKRL